MDNVLAVSSEDVDLTNSIKPEILAKYQSDVVLELICKCTFFEP